MAVTEATVDPSLLAARRWMVLGASGGGKSTYSRKLAEVLGLPTIHLDLEYWRPGWVEPPKPEWREKVAELASRDAWVMDGNYSGTLDLRAPRAEVAILLDPPVWTSLAGVYRRKLQYKNETRPDLPEGCPEQWPDLQFLHWIVSYKWRSRPRVLRLLGEAPHVRFFHLKSRRAAGDLLSELERAKAS